MGVLSRCLLISKVLMTALSVKASFQLLAQFGNNAATHLSLVGVFFFLCDFSSLCCSCSDDGAPSVVNES